jgi:hypothetical protein
VTKILEISTSDSLYEPYEIVIDGKVFVVKEVTLDVLEQIQDLYIEVQAGSAKALRKIVDILLGKDEVFGKMTMKQLKRVIDAAVGRAMNPDEDPEKNGGSPGDVATP